MRPRPQRDGHLLAQQLHRPDIPCTVEPATEVLVALEGMVRFAVVTALDTARGNLGRFGAVGLRVEVLCVAVRDQLQTDEQGAGLAVDLTSGWL